MKKSINVVLLIGFLASISFSCSENNENYCKKYTVYDYQYKSGRIDIGSKRLLESSKLDSKNRIIETVFYREASNKNWFETIMNKIYGLEDEKYFFKYNSEGQQILVEGFYRNGKFKMKTTQRYDSEGNIVYQLHYNTKDKIDKRNSIFYKNQYSLNKRDLLQKTCYKGNGSFLYKFQYEYYKNKNNITEICSNPKGLYNEFKDNYYPYPNEIQCYEVNKSTWGKSINQYDCKGKIIERIVQYEDEEFDFKSTINYDKKGNKVEQKWYSKSDYYHMKEANIPNNKNNNSNSYSENLIFTKLDRKYIAKYDSFRKIVEEVWYNKFGFMELRISYEYDSKGNLISKILYNRFNQPTYKVEYVYAIL